MPVLTIRSPLRARSRVLGGRNGGGSGALRLLDHLVGRGQQRFRDGEAEVVFVVDSPEIVSNLELVVELAERAHLPTITSGSDFVKAGSLMSYGADPGDLARMAAAYVDKVLRGAKPADLPIQQPTKFELAINRKTAKTLGLTIPETLLATADEVIQ